MAPILGDTTPPATPEEARAERDPLDEKLLAEAQPAADTAPPEPEHDAYRSLRKSSLYWLEKATREIEILDRIEILLPSFVRRRYIISSLYRWEPSTGKAHGSLDLSPVNFGKDDVRAADALHADVGKLFDWLVNKRPEVEQGDGSSRPARGLTEWNGTIHYEFTLTGLPGFEGGLRVNIAGLPPGSACHITKISKGKKVVEEFEYKMDCDDDTIPTEDAPKAVEPPQRNE